MASETMVIMNNTVNEAMQRGAKHIADVVGITLGPGGKNVIIEEQYGLPKITKDGVTVAKKIKCSGALGPIIDIIKNAASKANDIAGDGTTTTVVLSAAMIIEGLKTVAAGINHAELKRGMEIAAQHVISNIQSRSKKIKTSEEIAQVASVSANNDKSIGSKIAEAFNLIGPDGVITVEEGNRTGEDVAIEVTQGMHLDKGYISPYFVTNNEKMVCELENPYILVLEKKASSLSQLLPILEAVAQGGKSLLIIAEDVEGEALTALVVNKLRGGLKVAAVKAPGFGDRRKAYLEDISILTKATFITEDLGYKIENITLEQLGRASKVVISKDSTVIIKGAGDKESVDSRCLQIKKQIEDTDSQYDKDKLKERLAKLSGGIGVLKVGGATEGEVKERKDRVEDSYNATKAAIAEGIVPGGGATLLYASLSLKTLKGKTAAEDAGIRVVRRALHGPILRILSNAGIENANLIVDKLREAGDVNKIYDVLSGEVVNAFDSGIIDPTKVVLVALQSAISVATLMITTSAAIVEAPNKKECDKSSKSGYDGMGAGGMGDMDF